MLQFHFYHILYYTLWETRTNLCKWYGSCRKRWSVLPTTWSISFSVGGLRFIKWKLKISSRKPGFTCKSDTKGDNKNNVRVRIVLKRAIVGDWCFDNLSGSHLGCSLSTNILHFSSLSFRRLNFTAQEYSVSLRGPICPFNRSTCRTPSLGVLIPKRNIRKGSSGRGFKNTLPTRAFPDVLSCPWVRFFLWEISFVLDMVFRLRRSASMLNFPALISSGRHHKIL